MAAATPGLGTDLTAIATVSGHASVASAAASGAATGAAVGTVVPVVGTAIGAAVGAAVAAVSVLFGSGDTSPFQDTMMANLASLAAQGQVWAFQMGMGECGRWGLVLVDGGRTAHLAAFNANLPKVQAAPSDSVTNWFLKGASNWGGAIAQYPDQDKFAGPTTRFGSTDLMYQALQTIAQTYKFTLPAPTATEFKGGFKNASNVAGYNLGPQPSDELAAWQGAGPYVYTPPISSSVLSSLSTLFTTGTLSSGTGVAPAALWIFLVVFLVILAIWAWRRRG